MDIQKFNPTVAEIQAAILEVEGLKIKGIDDEAGYEAVKVAKKRFADYRIKISKTGKEAREEALRIQRGVLAEEKKLLAMIEPTETRLKGELEAVDEEKKRKEREILVPTRKKLLSEIDIIANDDVLYLDEEKFAAFYTEKKMAYLEEKDRISREKEAEAKRAKELEKAKKEAAEKAVIDERERAGREKKAEEMAKQAEIEKEKLEQKRLARNKKYKEWLEKNGFKPNSEFYILQDGNTFTLYKKVDSITI